MIVDQETVDRVVEFHGHMCPGVAMGIQAAQLALQEIGPHSKDEEVVAVVETDMCAVDAIQLMTGCTFGKGNLIHRDWGKKAFTFFRRSDNRAVRISSRPNSWKRNEEHQALAKKVQAGEASKKERARFHELHVAEAYRLLEIPSEQLFTVEEVHQDPPHKARIHTSICCSACGEDVMETRIRRFSGNDLCPPCFDKAVG